MIKDYLKLFLLILVITAQAPLDLVIDTNERDVEIQPGISGTKIVLFGAIPSGKRDIIIEVVGPPKNQAMQEKRRYFGFWLGRGKSYYKNVPSYYNLLSSKPLDEITTQEGLNKLGLGIERLPLGKANIKYSTTKQFEFDQRVKKLDSLKQDYEVKRLMSLDKGESIKQEIENTERQIQTYQAEKVGPQGELMRKQAQMEYDILGKVKKAVDKVAIDGGYDYIIDASVGLLYYKQKFDLTDDVLHELRKLDPNK